MPESAMAQPRLVHRRCGGWLARSAPEGLVQIGVLASTEPEARSAFEVASREWAALLQSSEPLSSANDCVGAAP